jgi:hypothetical protein
VSPITDKTLIPLGVAVLVIGGGAAWLTSISNATQISKDGIVRLEAKQDAYSNDLQKIYQELAEIKGELKRIYK